MAFVRGAQSLIAMPGVPFEMKHLLRDRVLPWLKDRYSALQHHACVVRTAGIPESTIAEKMESIQGEIDPRVAIAYLPGFEGTKIELKLEGSPDQSSELSSVLAQAQSKVARLFAPYVYALEDKAPDRLLAEWLVKTGHTFGTAESCTGGEIAAKLVKHSGISAVLKGGIVAYWPSVKESVLGVRHETISESGIVSADVAREMAEGARRVLKCDYAISITGIAEAPADSAAEAMPQAWLGFAGSGGTTTAHLKLMKDRRVNIEVAAYAALVLALRNLPGGILGF
jgi:nicotinamide-nucleotide amidase